MKYLVVIEKAGRNYSAFLPDVPGCIATGKTRTAALKAIREALTFHLEGLREDGDALPKPRASVDLVEA